MLAALLLTLGVGTYLGLYLQGIPYESDGGLAGWVAATRAGWGQMLGYFFSPVSERSTCGQGLTAANVRVTESLILKGIHDGFGDSEPAVAIYNVVVGVALALLVLWMVRKATGSSLAGLLCAVFLIATPAYGWCFLEYGDYAPSDQLFLLLYLAVFLCQFEKVLKDSPRIDARRIAGLALLWLMGMTAIRAKETGKFLVPALSFAMVLFNPGGNIFRTDPERRRKGFLPLCGVLALFILPIVLVKYTLPRPMFRSKFLLDPFYMLFFNPRGWDPEETTALFSADWVFPVSVAATLGTILSWLLILAGIVAAVLWWRRRKEASGGNPGISYAWLLGLWTLITLAFSLSFDTLGLTRYMAMSLLPMAMLGALGLMGALRAAPKKAKVVLGALLALLVLSQTRDNMRHSLYIRGELEGLWTPKWIVRKAVYADYTGRDDAGLFSSYGYLNSQEAEFPPPLLSYMWHHDERRKLAQDEKFQSLLQEYGVVYVGSKEPLKVPWKAELLRKMPTSKLSILTGLKVKPGSEGDQIYYLYKVSS